MIDAIEKNLNRGIKLLNSLSDEQYCCTSSPPYFSSIGSHIRHILDMFSCIFIGLESKKVDFSVRERNPIASETTNGGIEYFNQVITKLRALSESDLKMIISVTDELGTGKITTHYSLATTLVQAHTHAIHHYALIGFIIDRLKIQLPDDDFGYNPTTPKDK